MLRDSTNDPYIRQLAGGNIWLAKPAGNPPEDLIEISLAGSTMEAKFPGPSGIREYQCHLRAESSQTTEDKGWVGEVTSLLLQASVFLPIKRSQVSQMNALGSWALREGCKSLFLPSEASGGRMSAQHGLGPTQDPEGSRQPTP